MMEFPFSCQIRGTQRSGFALIAPDRGTGGDWHVASLWLHAADDPDGDEEAIEMIAGGRTYNAVLLRLLQNHRNEISYRWERREEEAA